MFNFLRGKPVTKTGVFVDVACLTSGAIVYSLRNYKHVQQLHSGPPANSFLASSRSGVDLTVEGSDQGKMGWKSYYTDCYEVETLFTPSLPKKPKKLPAGQNGSEDSPSTTCDPVDPLLEEALVQFANCFLDGSFFTIETILAGLYTGHYRPTAEQRPFQFKTTDPQLAVWKMEHRSHDEICMRWSLLGTGGRTWFSVSRVENPDQSQLQQKDDAGGDSGGRNIGEHQQQQPTAIKLRFGSAVWPFVDQSKPAAERHWTEKVDIELHRVYSKMLLAQAYSTWLSRGLQASQ